ncbi:MAG: hypothetical protein C0478_04415 [Planctomyces sp.]|nr:hypothetical protein [Planctomyces sp.]
MKWTRSPSTSKTRGQIHPFRFPRPHGREDDRRGMVLILVLVVTMFLTYGVASFSRQMTSELEATNFYQTEVRVQAAVESGIEYLATTLAQQGETAAESLWHAPAIFQGVNVEEAERARARIRFSIVSPLPQDVALYGVRYGVVDESGKLNLNRLPALKLTDEELSALLMSVPNMTEEIAAAIRDWIDTDEETLPNGAESDYYETLAPPYTAKNGPLESLDELLLVRGVTPQLLYGEDANRNGLLDVSEADGDSSLPFDNGDTLLDQGWSAYFTVHSREKNKRPDGTAKIYLNNDFLTDLYDELETEYGADIAKFVIAYRMNGPNTATSTTPETGAKTGATIRNFGGSPSGSSSQRGRQQRDAQAVQALVSGLSEAASSETGTVTRGGIDITKGGKVKVNSIFDLIGVSVTATVDGAQATLESPWKDEPDQLAATLPLLTETLSTIEDDFIEGRININEARPEILYGIPGMTEELVDGIIASQPVDSNGLPNTSLMAQRKSIAWLYAEGIADLATLRTLDPYITCRGSVFRAQVLGFTDGGGPINRSEVIVDATVNPPQVVFRRDLTSLGRGYPRALVAPVATE